ncbi:MAG: response regulator [Vicinamibacterales bacterium]
MDILIVDDDTTTLTLLQRILVREFACTVAEAHGGLAALALLAERRFDLIITDLTMPMMNGLELIEAVRQHEPLHETPVVVMSVERNEASVRRAIELGIAAYVIKPLDAAKVAHRLRPLIESLPVRGDSAPAGAVGRQRDGVSAQTPYLVVDGNADFRHFFSRVFSTERAVIAEATGVAAVTACLRDKPGVIFIGDDIGVLNAELLARKLRANRELGKAHLVRVLSGRLETAAPWELALDGQVRRTFVPDSFRAQVQGVLGRSARLAGVLLGQASLRLDMASAAEQVFGMMMGIEVNAALDPTTELPAGAFVASQTIDWDQGHERLQFAMRVDPDSGRLMTARMLSVEAGQVTDEMIAQATGEIANVVTGRLKSGFDGANIAVVCGPPVTGRLVEPWRSSHAARRLHVLCRETNGPVECTMTLEPLPPAALPANPEPALQGAE